MSWGSSQFDKEVLKGCALGAHDWRSTLAHTAHTVHGARGGVASDWTKADVAAAKIVEVSITVQEDWLT
eukprot:6010333-Amphidinium_carterae.2